MGTESYTNMGTTQYGTNEDFFFASQTEGFAAVLDGASGLTGKQLTGFSSDSAWFSSQLGSNLRTTLQDKNIEILKALDKAGKLTAKDYVNITGGKSIAREDEPSATLAFVRWERSSDSPILEAAVLGDCTCVLHYCDGTADILEDNHLAKFSKRAIDRLNSLMRDEGLSTADAREKVNDTLIEIRLLRNRGGGYWVADISCEGYSHAVTKAVSLDDVQGIFLCTDGYANAIKMGLCTDVLDLANQVRRGHGRTLLKALRKREALDSDMAQHPRFKIHDDATYIYIWMDN